MFQRINLWQRFISYICPLFWSEIPENIRSIPLLSRFKSGLKEFYGKRFLSSKKFLISHCNLVGWVGLCKKNWVQHINQLVFFSCGDSWKSAYVTGAASCKTILLIFLHIHQRRTLLSSPWIVLGTSDYADSFYFIHIMSWGYLCIKRFISLFGPRLRCL